jgi:hypothetical protein
MVAVLIMALMAFGFPTWTDEGVVWSYLHEDFSIGELFGFAILAVAAIGLVIHAAQESQRVKTSEAQENRNNVKRNHP